MLKTTMTQEERQRLIKEYVLNDPENPIHDASTVLTADKHSQTLVMAVDTHITEIVNLSNLEFPLLSTLLNAYEGGLPFVSYAQMLALYTEDEGVTVSDCRFTLSLPDGQAALSPMRKTVSRLGQKLKPLGINIQAILDTGYTLIRPIPQINVSEEE